MRNKQRENSGKLYAPLRTFEGLAFSSPVILLLVCVVRGVVDLPISTYVGIVVGISVESVSLGEVVPGRRLVQGTHPNKLWYTGREGSVRLRAIGIGN